MSLLQLRSQPISVLGELGGLTLYNTFRAWSLHASIRPSKQSTQRNCLSTTTADTTKDDTTSKSLVIAAATGLGLAAAASVAPVSETIESLTDDDIQTFLAEHEETMHVGRWCIEKAHVDGNESTEDRYSVVVRDEYLLAGIFDGHTGDRAAEYCAESLLQRIAHYMDESSDWISSIDAAYKWVDKTFLENEITRALKDPSKVDTCLSGACAVTVACENGGRVVAAGAGDARAVLIEFIDAANESTPNTLKRKKSKRAARVAANGGNYPGANVVVNHDGKTMLVTQLTRDHDAADPHEKARIEAQHPDEGDSVVRHGRVKGRLQPSRGIGDVIYKSRLLLNVLPVGHKRRPKGTWDPPYTTAEPDVYAVSGNNGILVMACDGVWDELTNGEVAMTVLDHMSADNTVPYNTATAIVRRALMNAGSRVVGRGKVKVEDCENDSSYLSAVIKLPSFLNRRDVHDDMTCMVIKV